MKNAQLSPRERERKSQDLILVYNPTDQDFIQPFDRVAFKIPAKNSDLGYGAGMYAVPRYVAELYVKNMIDKILGEKLINAIKQENDRRAATGQKPMDKYMGGEEDNYARQYRVDNEEARAEVFRIIWKGIHREYGFTDLMAEEEAQAPRDSRTLEERMAEEMDFPASPVQQDAPLPDNQSVDLTPDAVLEEKKNEAIAEVI